jgi:hypothetical protein
MKVIILGGGSSVRFGDQAADQTSVWLAEQGGEVLIERFVRACAPLNAGLIFAVRAQDIKRYRIGNVIGMAAPGSAIVPLNGETKGAACTALLCVQHINLEDELLIMNSNEFLDIDYKDVIDGFRDRGLDAGVVTFHSIHPRYSYMRVDGDGQIVEAAEKNPISRHAVAGFYWFRKGSSFLSAAQDMIRKDVELDGNFFISLAFNELVLKQKKLGITEVENSKYHPLKSRRQLEIYEGESAA